jgi:hypothetical protein
MQARALQNLGRSLDKNITNPKKRSLGSKKKKVKQGTKLFDGSQTQSEG